MNPSIIHISNLKSFRVVFLFLTPLFKATSKLMDESSSLTMQDLLKSSSFSLAGLKCGET